MIVKERQEAHKISFDSDCAKRKYAASTRKAPPEARQKEGVNDMQIFIVFTEMRFFFLLKLVGRDFKFVYAARGIG